MSDARIELAHGSGGRLMHDLLSQLVPVLMDGFGIEDLHDGASIDISGAERLAFTTDSFVVDPLEFPGGNIGSLAVNGTVNDLAMCGARPLVLSCSMIVEVGFPIDLLLSIARSMAVAAKNAGVQIVTGDTKVIERVTGGGLYINTAGVGRVRPGLSLAAHKIAPGDRVLISGDIGRHAMAVLGARSAFQFDPPIASDCRAVAREVEMLLASGAQVRWLRDPTRGGVAATLNELALATGLGFEINESSVPVSLEVRSAAELSGLDPMHLANEGCFVAVVRASDVGIALSALHRETGSKLAVEIGEVKAAPAGKVWLRTAYGAMRILPYLAGDQLPRIC